MTEALKLTRREFLVRSTAVGGGLLLGFHLPVTGSLAADSEPPPDQPQAVEVNAWIVIQPDNRVIMRVARSEMGQGIFTALPMLIAEELGCDWDRVQAEYAKASDNLRRDNVYVTMATGGSRSVRGSQEYLRKAGATARELLIAAAAQRWEVAVDECRAENSQVIHQPSRRKLNYGELAAEAARLPAPEMVFLKDPDEWTLIGKPVKRLDVPDKVAGQPVFAADVEIPGLLHAAIRACPVFGGRLKQFDAAAIETRPAVERVVALEDAVAVVADSWWNAQQALDALPVEWDTAAHGGLDDERIRALLEDGLTSKDTVIGAQRGDVAALLGKPGRQIEATYYAPYLAHATMEPMTCTARVRDNGVEVWAPTQNAGATLKAAAAKAGWGQPLPERHYRGIALETSYGSHCAQVVELRLNENGSFKLLRVVCAIDPGYVVNPDTVEAQVESAIVYGLTAALFGEITLKDGRVVQGNFHDYPMLLLKDMPVIETHAAASGDFWGGIGEPPLPPIAPAVCNALYAATDQAIHALPLSARGLHLS